MLPPVPGAAFMKRRSKTGGKAGKARRRKIAKPKQHIASAVGRRNRSPNADLQEQLDHSRRELKEALEQQAATSLPIMVERQVRPS
jgi:hypothetical protein